MGFLMIGAGVLMILGLLAVIAPFVVDDLDTHGYWDTFAWLVLWASGLVAAVVVVATAIWLIAHGVYRL